MRRLAAFWLALWGLWSGGWSWLWLAAWLRDFALQQSVGWLSLLGVLERLGWLAGGAFQLAGWLFLAGEAGCAC